MSEVSRHRDTGFAPEDLRAAVAIHVENLRRTTASEETAARVIATLTAEKGSEIARRVKGFLDAMQGAQLIELIDEDTYQQSLLGAIEFDENYRRSLGHLDPGEKILAGLVNFINPMTGIRESG